MPAGADRRTESLGDLHGLGPVRLRKQNTKLVPTEACHQIDSAQLLSTSGSDATEHLITGLVAERVIHHLEIVEIDGEQRERQPVAGGTG